MVRCKKKKKGDRPIMWSSSVSENEQRAAVGHAAENVQLDLLHRAQTSRCSGFFQTLFFTDSTRPSTAGPVTRDLSSPAGRQRTRFSGTVIKSMAGVEAFGEAASQTPQKEILPVSRRSGAARSVGSSRLLQNALLNRSLCILHTPGHRWWNKRS